MKGKKRIIVTLLFFINIIMLVAAVIPHHHHPNGMICMKQDLPVEQQCPTHHHHPGNDSCCSSECMTRFYSPTPSIHTDSGPDYVFIATLFIYYDRKRNGLKTITFTETLCMVRILIVPLLFVPLPTLFLRKSVNAN